MERLKSFLKSAFSYPRLLYKTHPVTAISIIAATALFAIFTFINSVNDWNVSFGMEIFLSVCLTVMFFSLFALGIESIRPEKSMKIKSVLFAIFAVLSFFMGFIIRDDSTNSHRWFFNMMRELKKHIGETSVFIYIVGLVALSILLAMYFSYGRSVKQDFNRHVMNINSKIFLSLIIYGVIQLGVIFLTLIVVLLLYDDGFEYLPTILVLINGLFYIPAVLYSLTHENEDANMFMQVIVRYISLVISLIAFVIIYIYMIKLVVTASVPSNSVFAILTALFVISMFISYMCTTFDDRGPLQKFAYYCPVIFAPFVLMQCYTMFVRIGQYGLTPMRYFGLAFILFEIVYIAYYMYTLKWEKEVAGSNILLIICAFIIICIFVPGINAKSLSVSVAKHKLSSYIKKVEAGTEVSDKELIHASASYSFLADDDFGQGKIEKYFPGLDEETFRALRNKAKIASEKLKEQNRDENTPDYEPNKYGWYHETIMEITGSDSLDVSGYGKMISVRIQDDVNGDGTDSEPVDTTKLNVYVMKNNSDDRITVSECPTVDLTDYCSDFIDLCVDYDDDIITRDTFNSRCRNISVVDVNENVRIYITDADINRNSSNLPVSVELEGCMFIK
ncbi:MAG: DUF4153 domain-containing protein [Lachnospiraceae bacterium]|nr:DUF4153 domain-containing protein [Lachnospiraceae bacterium]